MYSVEFENVSKIYKIYGKPTDRIKEFVFKKPYHRPISALNDLSFSVFKGEALGIIGSNGSGKSTLLKILAGTIRQTSGEVRSHGRLAALLELGAGFHPEFTGRQNIYLNASLLGIPEFEIHQRESEIIAFSGLNDFIDQPVNTYSSGMYVRLGFSIATSVDPEILIIDEALSVGDQRFQKKCIERMIEFRKSGKTIIFCSHSMYHVTELCDKAMWLHDGRIQSLGNKDIIVGQYENWCLENVGEDDSLPYAQTDHLARIKEIVVTDQNNEQVTEVRRGDTLKVVMSVESTEERAFHIGVGFRSISDEALFGISTKREGFQPISIEGGKTIEVLFPDIILIGGAYQAFAALLDESGLHIFDIKFSQKITVRKMSETIGIVYLEHEWRL